MTVQIDYRFEFSKDCSDAHLQFLDEIQRSIGENRIEAEIGSYAGTADLTLNTGVPVIDGVAAGAQILERPVSVYAKPIKK